MFGISIWELLIVALILFVVVGPAKLPGLAKSIGKGIKDLRKGLQDVKGTVDTDDEFVKAVREARQTVVEAKQSLQSLFDDDEEADEEVTGSSAGPGADEPVPRTGARGRPRIRTGRKTTEEHGEAHLAEADVAPPPVEEGPVIAAEAPVAEDFHRAGEHRPGEHGEAVPREVSDERAGTTARRKRPMITPGRSQKTASAGDPKPGGRSGN